VASRAAAYGLPGVEVDGNDALAVHRAAGEAVRRARGGEGPTLIECKTYRTRAHSEGMRDAGYRTQEEIAAWKARDPVKLLRAGILAAFPSAGAALASPLPEARTVMDHVYSEGRAGDA
jgi:2-oxoisovalerate dehydrogenase E1 component